MSAARVTTKRQLETLLTKLNECKPRKSLREASEPAEQDPAAATLNDAVEQLNSVRGGRSLKDEDVKAQLQRYWDGLDESERNALHAYLKGLAQIVSGQVDAAVAEEPTQHGVKTTKTDRETRTIKPNVLKRTTPATAATQATRSLPVSRVAASAAQPTAASSGRENTAAPMPIVPKKR